MIHKAVLVNKIVNLLKTNKIKIYVDTTLGAGGHFNKALDILKNNPHKSIMIGIDQDEKAILNTKTRLLKSGFKDKGKFLLKDKLKVYLIHDNFSNLESSLKKINITRVDFILADLGLSQDQIEQSGRGFSYNLHDEVLDMRLDMKLQVTAADLLNGLSKKELFKLFDKFADIKDKRLAELIVKSRKNKLFKTTSDLLKVIRQFEARLKNQDLKARVFQALRIAVNNEFVTLKELLNQGFEVLDQNGILAVITFHSGEDRIVKNFFKDKLDSKLANYVIELDRADVRELKENPRSASAKLRAIKKINKN